ncbi:DUF2218 domain-containing protein [Rhizobium tubonense]|uniref:2,4-dihydroxyhept-2-ene-1,7-dioic acid aldolase n=1 Tax=Rhizobium tubonense TaxID=484088 RepID=A0A2W4ECM6_9HYPH|nr:DUF2218 domain-containing protein [Rhizobium tubonense]PZM09793.1 hypothetical protein CPY51_26365 [Rhizobium tubonense]
MPVSVSVVKTDHASRYMQQLCKHWSHKFAVEFDDKTGKVPFSPDSNVEFKADETTLQMTLYVADAANRERMQNVVAEHLKRFAFREELDVVWTDNEGAL